MTRPPFDDRSDEEALLDELQQREYREVAIACTEEIVALARRVLEAVLAGDIARLVDECSRYDAGLPLAERRRLTRAELKSELASLQAIARRWSGTGEELARDLVFTPPAPDCGMPAQVLVCFGPEPPPVDDFDLYPARDCVELWWSGQVMPEANGPRHATAPPGTRPSRWRFHWLYAARSLRRQYLE